MKLIQMYMNEGHRMKAKATTAIVHLSLIFVVSDYEEKKYFNK